MENRYQRHANLRTAWSNMGRELLTCLWKSEIDVCEPVEISTHLVLFWGQLLVNMYTCKCQPDVDICMFSTVSYEENVSKLCINYVRWSVITYPKSLSDIRKLFRISETTFSDMGARVYIRLHFISQKVLQIWAWYLKLSQ